MEVDYNVLTLTKLVNIEENKMNSLELRSLRAKRGKAKEKEVLIRDYSSMERDLWHLVILSTGNEHSTYNGLYPNGVGQALEVARKNIKIIEDKIKLICH